VTAAVPIGDAASRLFTLHNAERARAGLAALRFDAGLAAVAQRRAADMATKGYFGHSSPTGETAFTLIASMGISAPYAAENIAENTYPASTAVDQAMSGFLNSPSHRQHIDDGHLTRAGTAVASGAGVTYFVVVFGGP
jgi:uncharacterized protein YkwD